MRYVEERRKRCAKCGRPYYDTSPNNLRLYSPDCDCARAVNREHARARYRRLRDARPADTA